MSSEIDGNKALADRYATALYALAHEQSQLDAVAADLRAVRAMLADSADLRRFVNSPALSRQDLAKAMAALVKQAGFNPLTGQFLGVLAQNRRLNVVGDVAGAYLTRLATSRGEVTAHVTAAYALSASDMAALTVALNKTFNLTVAINAVVDPAILGGLVVRVGSRMIDSSLRSKMQRLTLSMKGIG